MSLDEELKVEMEEFTSMSERMAALRKKSKALHSNMVSKLERMREKYASTSGKLIVVLITLTPSDWGRRR